MYKKGYFPNGIDNSADVHQELYRITQKLIDFRLLQLSKLIKIFKLKQPTMFKNYLCVYILDMSNTTTKLIRRSILNNACPDAYASSAPDNNGFRRPCTNIARSFRKRHRNGALASLAVVLRHSRSWASVCPPREVAGSFCDIWHENIQRLCYVCLSFPCYS